MGWSSEVNQEPFHFPRLTHPGSVSNGLLPSTATVDAWKIPFKSDLFGVLAFRLPGRPLDQIRKTTQALGLGPELALDRANFTFGEIIIPVSILGMVVCKQAFWEVERNRQGRQELSQISSNSSTHVSIYARTVSETSHVLPKQTRSTRLTIL